MVTFKKIVFPTDFYTSDKSALAHAIRLAELHQGEVLVQHVVIDDFERFAHAAVTTDVAEIQKHTNAAAENDMRAFMTPLPGAATNSVPIQRVLSKGKPAEEICALAEKEAADLIVMGSASGTVTGKVIRMTARPVLAFPTGTEAFRVQKILVPTDFSAHSTNVVRYAFELKDVFNASLALLYVIETPRAIEFAIAHGQFLHTIEKMKAWALRQLQSLIPEEFADDPRVVRIVERGHASQRIAAVAADIGADLMILGRHQHGSTHTHLLGTTTNRLLANTDKPVLTLKL